MNYLEAVNALLEAAGEPTVTTLVSPDALTSKFMSFFKQAYRFSNTWKRWPWTKAMTTVSATSDPNEFTLNSSVLEIIMVSHNGIPLSEKYTYEDLQRLTAGSSFGGTPTYVTEKNDGSIWVHPYPIDTPPESNLAVYAYTKTDDPVNNTDVLAGPEQYHDAVVALGYSIVLNRHFGDIGESRKARTEAMDDLRRVWSKARKHKSRPRFRV